MTTWPWYDRIGALADMLAGRTVVMSQIGDLTDWNNALSCPCAECEAVRQKLVQRRAGMKYVGTLAIAPKTDAQMKQAMTLATTEPAGNS